MRHLLEVFLMLIAPFCLFYAVFILVNAEWRITEWHPVARAIWVILSIWMVVQIFKKFGRT